MPASAFAILEGADRAIGWAGATDTNSTPTSDLVRHTTRQARARAPPRESSKVNSSGNVATFGAVMPAPMLDKLCTIQGSVNEVPWSRIRAAVFHSTRADFRCSRRVGMALSRSNRCLSFNSSPQTNITHVGRIQSKQDKSCGDLSAQVRFIAVSPVLRPRLSPQVLRGWRA